MMEKRSGKMEVNRYKNLIFENWKEDKKYILLMEEQIKRSEDENWKEDKKYILLMEEQIKRSEEDNG